MYKLYEIRLVGYKLTRSKFADTIKNDQINGNKSIVPNLYKLKYGVEYSRVFQKELNIISIDWLIETLMF